MLTDERSWLDAKALVTELVFRKYRTNIVVETDPALDLEDLVQEGLLACLDKQQTYDPDKGALSTWINTIADQHIANYLRGGGTVAVSRRGQEDRNDTVGMIYPDQFMDDSEDPEEHSPDFWDTLMVDHSAEYVEDAFANAELHAMLVSAMERYLEWPDNMLVAYAYGLFSLESMTERDLVDMFDIPKTTIRRRIARALIALRQDPDLQAAWDAVTTDPEPLRDETSLRLILSSNKHRR